MELRRCCKKHQATDRLWSLLVMVYVLCRIVGDAGQPKMLELTGSDALARNALVQSALTAFGKSTEDLAKRRRRADRADQVQRHTGWCLLMLRCAQRLPRPWRWRRRPKTRRPPR